MRHLNLKIKSLIILGILTICINCAYQNKNLFDDQNAQERREKILQELNLTKDQQEQIKQLWVSQKPVFEKKQEALFEARKQLNIAMKQEAPNEELKNLFFELEKKRGDLFLFRFDHVIAIRDILTSEQKQKFFGFRPHIPNNNF